jgi:hypothetical protein
MKRRVTCCWDTLAIRVEHNRYSNCEYDQLNCRSRRKQEAKAQERCSWPADVWLAERGDEGADVASARMGGPDCPGAADGQVADQGLPTD